MQDLNAAKAVAFAEERNCEFLKKLKEQAKEKVPATRCQRPGSIGTSTV
jgi:hypothetical protein